MGQETAKQRLDYWFSISRAIKGEESHDCKASPDSGCQVCMDIETYRDEQEALKRQREEMGICPECGGSGMDHYSGCLAVDKDLDFEPEDNEQNNDDERINND